MTERSKHLPVLCAGGTVLLAALPFGVERVAPAWATLTVASLCGAVFVFVGFRWPDVVHWLHGDQVVVTPLAPTFNQTVDLQFWRLMMRGAYPAFVISGVSLVGHFLLEAQPPTDATVNVGAGALVVAVLAWFAPLFVRL